MHNIYIDKNGNKFDGNTSDVTGMIKCQLDIDGNPYSNYNIDGNPDTILNEAETLKKATLYFTDEIQKHIDEAMVVFNETNNVVFSSLANMDSASNRVGYSKQAQCKVFVDWAYITVWDTMRTWQSTLIALPTEAEFRAKLATVAYVA